MPRIKHVVESIYQPSFRSSKVAGMFDVPVTDKLRREWDLNIPFETQPWQIGLITGASGSGKTTLAHKLFENKVHHGFEWKSNCLLDDFPESCDVKTITEILSKVGFSSPPAWLLPYAALSNGQKFRVELARCLLEYDDIFAFDEFTSVVDRQVAQVSAYAFQKAVRKTEKKFVAVTCHYDVEEWLEPDWVFDVPTNNFTWGSLRRPPIEINIFRVHHKAWELFSEYHYLSASINKAAVCFVGTINDRPVVFDSWLPFFGKLRYGKGMRDHRRVVLPDFQGLGIGLNVNLMLSSMWKAMGYRVFSGTAHPAEIRKRIESPDWVMTRQGRTGRETGNKKIKHASDRLTAGFEYIGNTMLLEVAKRLHAG